ncbi:hypothetical protein KAR91_03040, partial [Candidatus Pacearchaeota archaeon]|nr:hypothetical protein [Candidatus Pacearchaeota archaeon]
DTIQCGFPVTASNGDQYIYGGSLVGTIFQLENGPSWAGSDITNTVQTGDFFPSGNEWDITRIRRLKFSAKRVTESDAQVNFYYLADTDDDGGLNVTFRDVLNTVSNGDVEGVLFTNVTAAMANSGQEGVQWVSQSAQTLDLSITSGFNRLMRNTLSLNQTAWCHSFKFEFTSSETNKGMQPVMWGIVFEFVRKDYEDLE